MRALEPGFRLRLRSATQDAAETIVRAARNGSEALELREGGRHLLRSAEPLERTAWIAYAERIAAELDASLATEATFGATPAPFGLAVDSHAFGWSHLLNLRTWGIGFDGPPLLIDEAERRVFGAAVHRLGTRLRSASRILAKKPYDPDRLPGLVAEELERLVCDVLNEQESVATLANMDEDFLEKTDLRVRYPELARKRGARVQVAWTVDERAFRRKAESMRYREEMVFVTPFTLAKEFPETPQQIVHRFRYALRHATQDPRGPLAMVAPQLREAIRTTVRQQALSTTERLRDRQGSR